MNLAPIVGSLRGTYKSLGSRREPGSSRPESGRRKVAGFSSWAGIAPATAPSKRWDVPIYVASNAFWEPIEIELPEQEDRRWYRVVDTSLPEGEDIVPQEEAVFLPDDTYEVPPRSTIILIAR